MSENETPKQDAAQDKSSIKPVAEVKITPPQSVSVKNSMPKDVIPSQIVDVVKNAGTQNGKEEK